MKLRLSILIAVQLVFLLYVSSASALWGNNGSNIVLFNEGGTEVIQEWTPGEWQAQRHLMEGTRECIDDAYADCTKALLNKETGMKDPITQGEAESADNIYREALVEGDELPGAVTRELDIPSEAGGFLDLGLAGTVLGAVTLGPVAFKLGVDIGNELDQIFGFEKLEEEKTEPPKVNELCTVEKRAEFTLDFTSSGGEKKTFPEGYYGNCHVNGGGVKRIFKAKAITSCEDDREVIEGMNLGLGHVIEIITTNEPGINTSCHPNVPQEYKQKNTYEYWLPEPVPHECLPGREFPSWLSGIQRPCYPEGIPHPGGLPAEIKKSNHEHGLPEVPKSTPATLPAPGKADQMPEKTQKGALEILPARTWIKTRQTTTVKKMREEEEEKTIEIPQPEPAEVGTHYVTRVGELGFTHVTVETLPETAIDVTVGPNEVSKVVPAPGTFVVPSHEVIVEVNPADAPTPAEPGKGIGTPTLPGLKPPSFPILCKGFPFGVPCWLIKTIQGWSSAAVCPEWGLENVEIDGKHITGKFDLCKLEPIMSKVRVAMILFATIGLVILFFNFAKGGGAKSGGQGDSDSGNVDEHQMAEGNSF